MSYVRIIPSILIYKKKCYKGKNFSNYINVGNPISTAISFDSQKADELFIIDLDAYKNNIKPDFNILRQISENISTPLTFGGGIKTYEDVKNSFRNGADKVFLNSVLLEDLSIIKKSGQIFGEQSIVGGINLIKVEEKYRIYNSNSKTDPIDHLIKLQEHGVGELKITFVDTEGTRKGIDIKFCENILNELNIPCIFEGGISTLKEIKQLITKGITSISLGAMLYFGDNNIIKIKKFLINENLPVSLDY